MTRALPCLVLALVATATSAHAAEAKASERKGGWLGDELPLPLTVKNPQDLQFKQVTEREYLVFNLLAAGKIAWDAGKFLEAADAWETLLTLPALDREIDKVVRPLAIDARKRAGQVSTIAAVAPPPPKVEEAAPARAKAAPRGLVDVAGSVTGGGTQGPGGAVVMLHRADGKTPAPNATGEFVVVQTAKQFQPRVLAVPVGASVAFRNDDPIFHNVFSLSQPNEFDLGLYKSGLAKAATFTKPGAVQLFCNIHAQMNGWVYVVDSPWYGIAGADGKFVVRNVPAGDYTVEIWHESASQLSRSTAKIDASMAPLAFVVGGDRRAPAFPPDKYGKQRQVQLGY